MTELGEPVLGHDMLFLWAPFDLQNCLAWYRACQWLQRSEYQTQMLPLARALAVGLQVSYWDLPFYGDCSL